MRAKNKLTGEVLHNLDPSDTEDRYYSLDKREWDFIEEFTWGTLLGSLVKVNAIVFWSGLNQPVREEAVVLHKMDDVILNTSGGLVCGNWLRPFDS